MSRKIAGKPLEKFADLSYNKFTEKFRHRRSIMDNIKEKIEEIVEKIKGNDDLVDLFKKDPIKAVEKVLDVDLPDDLIEKIVDGVKAKMAVDGAKDVLGALKKLF
jgi:hypothetical protein